MENAALFVGGGSTSYLPSQKPKIIIAITFQILKHETRHQFLIDTQVDSHQTPTKHARFYIMAALPDADWQDLIRNERLTGYSPPLNKR